ncbi:Serine/threonine-protein kinase AtPK2/AtPK19 [Bienertia sinuspersici]
MELVPALHEFDNICDIRSFLHFGKQDMVSSQLSAFTESRKSFRSPLLLPDNPPNAILADDHEFDFSDVFGPLSVQLPGEVNEGNPETTGTDVSDLVYDDPVVPPFSGGNRQKIQQKIIKDKINEAPQVVKPINWKKLEARQVQPSFRPDVAGQLCTANFEKCWTDMPLVISPAASPNANEISSSRTSHTSSPLQVSFRG